MTVSPIAGEHDTLATVDPTSDPRWATLVQGRRSDVFHAPGWLRVLRDTYALTPRARLLLDHDGRPEAGWVYVHVDDVMDPRLVSLPFSDFCDPLVDTAEQWRVLSEGLLGEEHRVHMRCLHSTAPVDDPRLTLRGRDRWHGIDLARGGEEIWAGIASSARRSIRKARAQGVVVRAGTTVDDLRAFHDLHLRVRKYKYGLLAQPWRFFERIFDELLEPGAGVLLLAELEGRVLGGVLFLEWGDTLYYKYNASDIDHLEVRPNDLMIWTGIEHALERGLDRFDFGLSDWDQDGLVRFKRKYATEEKPVHHLEHMPDGCPGERERTLRGLLPELTSAFVRDDVPDAVTARAGDLLYGFFT